MSHRTVLSLRLSALFLGAACLGAGCDGGASHGALDLDAGGLQGGDQDGGGHDPGDGDGGEPLDDPKQEDAGSDAQVPGDAGQGDASCGGETCGEGEFCDYVAGSQCGALDHGGACKPKRDVCPAIYAPVCGCDGKTYGSACNANAAGVSVKSQGECKTGETTGKTCGGFAGLNCGSGQFCNYDETLGGQSCGIADGAGVCRDLPGGCTKEVQPVCGCNGMSYDNACTAHMNGVSVASQGKCR